MSIHKCRIEVVDVMVHHIYSCMTSHEMMTDQFVSIAWLSTKLLPLSL
jgi:hypothetical protein